MAKRISDLEQEIAELRALMAQAGIVMPVEQLTRPEDQPDYIAHGSPEHAGFIGLIVVDDSDQAAADNYVIYMSQATGKTYRLEDELGAVHFYPGIDPDKSIRLVLLQKVNAFEAGKPPIPAEAPPMFRPGLLPT